MIGEKEREDVYFYFPSGERRLYRGYFRGRIVNLALRNNREIDRLEMMMVKAGYEYVRRKIGFGEEITAGIDEDGKYQKYTCYIGWIWGAYPWTGGPSDIAQNEDYYDNGYLNFYRSGDDYTWGRLNAEDAFKMIRKMKPQKRKEQLSIDDM